MTHEICRQECGNGRWRIRDNVEQDNDNGSGRTAAAGDGSETVGPRRQQMRNERRIRGMQRRMDGDSAMVFPWSDRGKERHVIDGWRDVLR